MLVVLAVVFGLAVLPQMWVSRVIAAHGAERADFPGTGGEFARHILDEMKLGHIKVEETDAGDHYDPEAKAIRLLPQHFGGRRWQPWSLPPTRRATPCRTPWAIRRCGAHAARQTGDPGGEGGRRRHAGRAHRHGDGQGAAHC